MRETSGVSLTKGVAYKVLVRSDTVIFLVHSIFCVG